jgi:NAD(P)-dependent dehydrogenase (short-subunit alcohol dehydrogenase family)
VADAVIGFAARECHIRGMENIVLVTGTSSGIGRACAEHLAASGFRVFAGQRRLENGPAGAELVQLDVDDEASIANALAVVKQKAGRLDAVINNAGNAWMGSIEDTSIDEARAQLETNFFGVLRMVRAVLPLMREQGGGRIINISSLAGVLGLPFSGLYSASKFAFEGLSESLRLEALPFGVKVSLVEPGDFDTGLPAARKMTKVGGVYEAALARTRVAQEKDEAVAPKPAAVAKLVHQILRSRSPKLRYHVGRWAQRIVVPLKRFLPQTWFEWILRQAI